MADVGGQVRISTGGGTWAQWSPDGEELFYRGLDGAMMAVRYTVGEGELGPELPRELFEYPQSFARRFIVAPDGERFLVYDDVDSGRDVPVQATVVVHWFDELADTVPTDR